MVNRSRTRIPAVLLVLLSSLAGPALGDDDDIGHEEARRLLESGRVIPLEQILEQLHRNVPGKLLETEIERDDGRIIYDLKILRPDGRVQEVEVDAATGEILKIEDDD
jgi:uncharacterized membrane protein YkoI